MEIFEADVSDVEYLIKNLWRPLVEEMEGFSKHNSLSDVDLQSEAFRYFTGRLNDDNHKFFILEEDGDAVGFVGLELRSTQSFFEMGDYIEIHELFVVEEYRRNGVGSKLLERAETFAEENECDSVQLSVDVRNMEAKKLYAESGFDDERVKMIKEL